MIKLQKYEYTHTHTHIHTSSLSLSLSLSLSIYLSIYLCIYNIYIYIYIYPAKVVENNYGKLKLKGKEISFYLEQSYRRNFFTLTKIGHQLAKNNVTSSQNQTYSLVLLGFTVYQPF